MDYYMRSWSFTVSEVWPAKFCRRLEICSEGCWPERMPGTQQVKPQGFSANCVKHMQSAYILHARFQHSTICGQAAPQVFVVYYVYHCISMYIHTCWSWYTRFIRIALLVLVAIPFQWTCRFMGILPWEPCHQPTTSGWGMDLQTQFSYGE